jgi:hypothetical protein
LIYSPQNLWKWKVHNACLVTLKGIPSVEPLEVMDQEGGAVEITAAVTHTHHLSARSDSYSHEYSGDIRSLLYVRFCWSSICTV